jgi:hypothetical protein
MYGLIHSALRQMVLAEAGEGMWLEILQEAGVKPDVFLAMRANDDAITFSLVGATAQSMDLSVGECLERFGRYWLVEYAPSVYGDLMSQTGTEVFEFLGYLNQLHERISTSFVNFRPPSFDVHVVSDDIIEFHYISPRLGLTPFVRGILYGLPEMFHCDLEVKELSTETTQSGEHSVFLISRESTAGVEHA